MKDFKVGIVQLPAKRDKNYNLEKMVEYVEKAASDGADIVCLPEMWNCPYQNSYFVKFKEKEYDISYKKMSEVAKSNNIYLVGGSIPVSVGDKIYNRSYVFNRNGEEIYRYSKVNLFDIEGFKESDTISGGKSLGCFETEFGTFGLAICFDLRFPEMFQKFREFGAEVIFAPSTFLVKTGEKHFQLLNQSRAIDSQCYMISPTIARDDDLSRNAYAHSLVVEPSGDVVLDMGIEPSVKVVEIKAEKVKREREKFPLETSRENRKLS